MFFLKILKLKSFHVQQISLFKMYFKFFVLMPLAKQSQLLHRSNRHHQPAEKKEIFNLSNLLVFNFQLLLFSYSF